MPQSHAKWPGRLQVAFLLTEGNRWEIAPFPNSGVRRPRAAAGAGKQLLPRERTWGTQGELDTAGGPSLHLRRAGGTPAPETGPRSSEGPAVASRGRPPTQPRPRGGLDAAVKGKRRGGGPGPSPAAVSRECGGRAVGASVGSHGRSSSPGASGHPGWSRCSAAASQPGVARACSPQPTQHGWETGLGGKTEQTPYGPVRPRWRAESGCRDDCRPAWRQDSNTETRVVRASTEPSQVAGSQGTDRLSNLSAKGPPLPPGIQVCPSPEGEGGVTFPQRLANICISRKQNPPSKPGARHLHFKGWLVSLVGVGAGWRDSFPSPAWATRMAARNYLGSATLLHANMLFFIVL
ncbi:PREDICTED: collagen alpha-1(XVII) chain-like [Dipodomys ordii]|uniref:Collagen alpha-1(XVII) chain-like n=1 Tax=Dipodomys ordii TaxID=10020 RepID=A0A1S3GDC7_DIPOR|nr:PREDICTED: collagen alpha-1(XVII) chain-like [Dipodomys ordii]